MACKLYLNMAVENWLLKKACGSYLLPQGMGSNGQGFVSSLSVSNTCSAKSITHHQQRELK